jgi:hypothetical protein
MWIVPALEILASYGNRSFMLSTTEIEWHRQCPHTVGKSQLLVNSNHMDGVACWLSRLRREETRFNPQSVSLNATSRLKECSNPCGHPFDNYPAMRQCDLFLCANVALPSPFAITKVNATAILRTEFHLSVNSFRVNAVENLTTSDGDGPPVTIGGLDASWESLNREVTIYACHERSELSGDGSRFSESPLRAIRCPERTALPLIVGEFRTTNWPRQVFQVRHLPVRGARTRSKTFWLFPNP